MEKTVTVICNWCGKEVVKLKGEVKRRIKNGHDKFYCNGKCSTYYRNSKRTDRRTIIKKKCLCCKKEFTTLSGSKSPIFCSRSCASKGSVTSYRRKRAVEIGRRNLSIDVHSKIASSLRSREKWKYVEIENVLIKNKVQHCFEYPIEKYIFDLAIIDKKILIEFDGKYHEFSEQTLYDNEKDRHAENLGWTVFRMKTDVGVISPRLITSFIKNIMK